jgi:hypothetical protein
MALNQKFITDLYPARPEPIQYLTENGRFQRTCGRAGQGQAPARSQRRERPRRTARAKGSHFIDKWNITKPLVTSRAPALNSFTNSL